MSRIPILAELRSNELCPEGSVEFQEQLRVLEETSKEVTGQAAQELLQRLLAYPEAGSIEQLSPETAARVTRIILDLSGRSRQI